jgi:hypothetical protein
MAVSPERGPIYLWEGLFSPAMHRAAVRLQNAKFRMAGDSGATRTEHMYEMATTHPSEDDAAIR